MAMNQGMTAMPMGPICPGCGHPATATWVDDQGDWHYRHEQTTTAPGPDECVVGTDPAVAVFTGTLSSIDLRPAKACSVCGQPLASAVLDFHPIKQDCIRALRARVEALDREIHAAGLRATTGASRKPLEMRCSHCQQTTPIRLEGLFQALAKDRA